VRRHFGCCPKCCSTVCRLRSLDSPSPCPWPRFWPKRATTVFKQTRNSLPVYVCIQLRKFRSLIVIFTFFQGCGNLFASFFSCVPFAASLSRSLIQQNVGGKTQIASVFSCTFILLILLAIGPFFEPLPNVIKFCWVLQKMFLTE
jgi:Sulfate permease family